MTRLRAFLQRTRLPSLFSVWKTSCFFIETFRRHFSTDFQTPLLDGGAVGGTPRAHRSKGAWGEGGVGQEELLEDPSRLNRRLPRPLKIFPLCFSPVNVNATFEVGWVTRQRRNVNFSFSNIDFFILTLIYFFTINKPAWKKLLPRRIVNVEEKSRRLVFFPRKKARWSVACFGPI